MSDANDNFGDDNWAVGDCSVNQSFPNRLRKICGRIVIPASMMKHRFHSAYRRSVEVREYTEAPGGAEILIPIGLDCQ